MTPLALTMGDPAGIGGELTLRAWQALRRHGPCFVALDDPRPAAPRWLATRLAKSRSRPSHPQQRAQRFGDALPVLPVRLAARRIPGRPDKANARGDRLDRACRRAGLSGAVGGVVTNPINKAALYDAGFAYPGHTEFLAALTGASGRQIMMLASPELRVVPVTVHASLRNSIAMLTTERDRRRRTAPPPPRCGATSASRGRGSRSPGSIRMPASRARSAMRRPRIIAPAIDALRAEGIDVSGPWPPDTMFTATARSRYDVAICMYHDQALIPLKTLDMDHGVNVTLGLPIVRTSPDHGTAYDIAGKGIADPSSLIAAIELAATLATRRHA